MKKKLIISFLLALVSRFAFLPMPSVYTPVQALQHAAFTLSGHYFFSTNCAIASPSSGTLSGALSAAGSGTCTGTANANTVAVTGTSGAITSTITIPCNANFVGPTVTYSQTPNQTAVLIGSSGFNGWMFQTTAGCSASQTIQYLEFNGERPSNGGGNIYITPGTTNLNILNSYFHGVNAPGGDVGQNTQASLIFFGVTPNATTTTSNVLIQNNVFGATSFGDCATAMGDTSSGENDNGGLCNGIGINPNVSNLTVTNNIFHWLEQSMKLYEICTPGCRPGGIAYNIVVNYNSFSEYSRIGFETQANWGNSANPTLMYIRYNNWGTRYGSLQSYDLSAANGCSNSYAGAAGLCETHSDYNYELQSSGGADVGFEIWGQGTNGCTTNCTTANYNLFQGYLYNAITWATAGNFKFNNNIFNIVNNGNNTSCTNNGGSGYFHPEDSPAYNCDNSTGNTYSNAITGTYTSTSPTVSPAGGSFSGSVHVTLTNPGTNLNANTGIWYTTDGTTPVVGGGTSKFAASGTVLTFTTTTVLKTLGMWGSYNQPYSWPSGFGFVPSSVTTNTYTAGVTPTLTSCSSSNSGLVSTLTVGGAPVQQAGLCYYSSVPITTTCSPNADAYGNAITSWVSGSPSIGGVGNVGAGTTCTVGTYGAGCVYGIAAGTFNVNSSVGATPCGGWTFTVSHTLTGLSIATTGSVTSLTVPNTNQLIPTCTYSSGAPDNCTGLTVSYTSSNGSYATVTLNGGLVTAVAPGSVNLGASISSVSATPIALSIVNPSGSGTPIVINPGTGLQGQVNTQ